MVNGRIPRETVRVAEGIGIIGAGVAGLHLLTTVAHHNTTVTREQAYLPRLIDDYTGRGGDFRVRGVGPDDLAQLARDHELIVVAVGKSGLASLFPPLAGRTPYEKPPRRLCGGLYRGIAYSEPKGVTTRTTWWTR
jgi:hypothetical protein